MVGAAALLLSAIPGLQSDTSSFDQPESIHLALLGLATLLFTPFSRSRSSGAQKLASALLVIAVVAQTFILLAPLAYYGAKGFGFVRLQQLATEHLIGARG